MSLSISVAPLHCLRADDGSIVDDEGWEWITEELDGINAALAEAGLPRHREPESAPEAEAALRSPDVGLSFGDLHALRAVYARVVLGTPGAPMPPRGEEYLDPAIDELTGTLVHHLIDHSDGEGYYVPIDFDEVLVAPDALPFGSCRRLLAELGVAAPALGTEVDADGRPTAAAFDAATAYPAPDADGLAGARRAWAQLAEAAWIAVTFGVAIRFE